MLNITLGSFRVASFSKQKTQNGCNLCRVESGLKRRWPKNLTVKRLEIVGSLNVNDIEYLSSIDFELELNMDCIPARNMYQLLERIGHFVKTLTIENKFDYRQNIGYARKEIIVEQILTACPNLEHFEFKTNRPVVQDDKYDLPPSCFKNYQ
jgi:hypothetical protein